MLHAIVKEIMANHVQVVVSNCKIIRWQEFQLFYFYSFINIFVSLVGLGRVRFREVWRNSVCGGIFWENFDRMLIVLYFNYRFWRK